LAIATVSRTAKAIWTTTADNALALSLTGLDWRVPNRKASAAIAAMRAALVIPLPPSSPRTRLSGRTWNSCPETTTETRAASRLCRAGLAEAIAKASSTNRSPQLQTWLAEIGYSVGPADGKYEARTIRAVLHFQTHFIGKGATDRVNRQTAALINAVRQANPKAL
jgi:hypothetical protein